MAVLEQIMQMKQQGIADDQIIQSLKDQGIQPKEINEALSQSTIKSAIDEQPGTTVETEFQKRPLQNQQAGFQTGVAQQQTDNLPTPQTPENMQPSMMPSATQMLSPETQPAGLPQQQFQQPIQNYQYQQDPQEEYYQSSDIETINEIAEQIIEEKTQELKKQILSLTKLKQEISPEIQNLNKRLEKIENTFSGLQLAILKKIGDYGENIKNISEGLNATQESFSKMINPVLDNQRNSKEPVEVETNKNAEIGLEGHESQQSQEQKPRRRKKNSPGFEHYLR